MGTLPGHHVAGGGQDEDERYREHRHLPGAKRARTIRARRGIYIDSGVSWLASDWTFFSSSAGRGIRPLSAR